MSRDDIQKLLGGYATGTLTPEEQQALFEAALDDQELFDALAREQALRDLLRDPAAKARVLAALDQRPPRWYEGLIRGWRPLAGALAMAGVGAVAVAVWQGARSSKPVLVAQVSPPSAAASPMAARPPEPAPTPPAANPTQQPPAARDTNSPIMRDKDAPPGRFAKQNPPKAADGEGVREEDRRAKEKQVAEPTKRGEVADSLPETPSASKGGVPLPAAPPMPPRAVASGFREGATPAGLGGVPREQQPLAEPKTPPVFRSATGNATGGMVGGVLGGIVGGKPGAAPPAPATPKADVQSPLPVQAQTAQAQSATSQAKLSQSGPSQQGQQGASSPPAQLQSGQAQAAPPQLERARLLQPPGAAAETVEVTAAAASLDAVSSQDAKSLFYGNSVNSIDVPGARSGSGGGGGYSSPQSTSSAQNRKKLADQVEKAQAGRQAMAVSTISANTRTQAHLLNLGVRYSLLRKTAAGGFEQVEPDSVKTGDILELQLIPNYAGSLLVKGRSGDGPWRLVRSFNVAALKPYTTPLKSGENELQVTLTRVPAVLTGASLRDDESGTNTYQQSTIERATYVVTSPASPQLRFTINLNYK